MDEGLLISSEEAAEFRRGWLRRLAGDLRRLEEGFTALTESVSVGTATFHTGGETMAKLTITKSDQIQMAFHATGGLRDKALTDVRRHRDRARDKISINEVPDLSEYIKAVAFRDWVFKVEPAKEGISWEDALSEVYLKANTRIYELSAPDLIFTAHEDLCNRMEVAAIHDFLNRTRALLK